MRRLLFLAALLSLGLSSPTALTGCDTSPSGVATGGGSNCCRVCTTGKACGDSCISRSSTCRQGAGCACNG